MSALAGGDVTRVFNYSSYDKFKASILEVVAAACESDAKDSASSPSRLEE